MATFEKRTTPAGKTTHRVKIRIKGYPTEQTTFDRLTDARRWATQTEAAIREGRYFKTRESQRHTLSDLIDRYIRDTLPHKGSKPKQQQLLITQLNWWKDRIGAYFLSDVTPAMIAEQRDAFLSTPNYRGTLPAPATVNRYMAILSHAFSTAQKEWGWIEDNPVRNVKKPKEARGRVRFLSDDERKRFLQACKENQNQYLYLVVVLALSTGARHGEIMGLRWNQIDFRRGVITLHDTKNGERRLLPLKGHAFSLMQAHAKIRRLDTDLLFPNRKGTQPVDIRKAFTACLELCNIEDFRFHDLRHSAASYLAMNGASLAEIADVLGHKTLQMVKRYTHLSEAHTSKEVESMNERIFS